MFLFYGNSDFVTFMVQLMCVSFVCIVQYNQDPNRYALSRQFAECMAGFSATHTRTESNTLTYLPNVDRLTYS